MRRDGYNYYPSGNPLADSEAPIQSESVSQQRSLLNAGRPWRVDESKRGINSIKAGTVYQHTFLREHDNLGLINATFNSPCVDANGNPQPGFTDPAQCAAAGPCVERSVDWRQLQTLCCCPMTLPAGDRFMHILATPTSRNWLSTSRTRSRQETGVFNLGIRGDLYNGLTVTRQPEPRVGVAYNIKQTNTVLRVSYARTLETPFNENLVLSSSGCGNEVLAPLLACTPGFPEHCNPASAMSSMPACSKHFGKNFVNQRRLHLEIHAQRVRFQHTLATHQSFFPIDWHNSKIPGYAIRADVPNYHHLSAFVVIVLRCRPILSSAERRRGRNRWPDRAPVPHRP